MSLAGRTVTLVGLQHGGAELVLGLAAAGVAELRLIDPYPIPREGDDPKTTSWQDAVAHGSRPAAPGVVIRTGPGCGVLTREALDACLPGSDLVIASFGLGLDSALFQVNAAAVAHGTPTIMVRHGPGETVLGPVVLPHRSACYACWRLRAVGCCDHLERALIEEQIRGRLEHPNAQVGPADRWVHWALRAASDLPDDTQRSTTGRVVIVDEHGNAAAHTVLRHHACPICGSGPWDATPNGSARGRGGEAPAEAPGARVPDAEAEAAALRRLRVLVDPVCGLVRATRRLSSPAADPAAHEVVRADLADTYLTGEATAAFGRGATESQAALGALLEAAERYSIAARGRIDNAARDTPANAGSATARASACAFDEAAATRSALLEAGERDAFAVSWGLLLPVRRRMCADHPDAHVRDLVREHARRGISIVTVELPTDLPIAVCAAFCHAPPPAPPPLIAVGLGAAEGLAEAAARAISEAVQVRRVLLDSITNGTGRERAVLVSANPAAIREPIDRALFYALGNDDLLTHFLDAPAASAGRSMAGARAGVASTTRLFHRHGHDVRVQNVTAPELVEVGLSVVEVEVANLVDLDRLDDADALRARAEAYARAERLPASCTNRTHSYANRPLNLLPVPFA